MPFIDEIQVIYMKSKWSENKLLQNILEYLVLTSQEEQVLKFLNNKNNKCNAYYKKYQGEKWQTTGEIVTGKK